MKSNRILWADDDPDDLMFFREVLRELDYKIPMKEENNGKEALAPIKSKEVFKPVPIEIFIASRPEGERR